MKFDWRGFTEEGFLDYCAKVKSGAMEVDWWVGNVRAGTLCFDLVTRCYGSDEITLTYDLYVGGVDTGYGYKANGYPYDYDDGDNFPGSCADMTYEAFKEMAEDTLAGYIAASGHADDAEKPLLIW